jgi:predicted enzyme related to lactoylglutathione lyase
MVLKRDISRGETEMTETMTETETRPQTKPETKPEAKKVRRNNNMVWFELPVSDLERAKAFYEAIFVTELQTHQNFPGIAMFPKADDSTLTGALAHDPDAKPSTEGAIVYLNCDGQLDAVLSRAQKAGAQLLQEVAQLPGNMGWVAQFRDLDGNRVGLHAMF